MRVSIYFLVIAMLGWNVFLAQRDRQLFKAYDACMQYTFHPDCPDSWKANFASHHR